MNWMKVTEILQDTRDMLDRELRPHHFHYLLVMMPYPEQYVRHMAAEERKQMEKRVVAAAQAALMKSWEEVHQNERPA